MASIDHEKLQKIKKLAVSELFYNFLSWYLRIYITNHYLDYTLFVWRISRLFTVEKHPHYNFGPNISQKRRV